MTMKKSQSIFHKFSLSANQINYFPKFLKKGLFFQVLQVLQVCADPIIYPSNLLPQITLPTRLTSIFIDANEESISGNVIITISYHLDQIVSPKLFFLKQPLISNLPKKHFEKENFISDFKKIDWDNLFSDCKQNAYLSYFQIK